MQEIGLQEHHLLNLHVFFAGLTLRRGEKMDDERLVRVEKTT